MGAFLLVDEPQRMRENGRIENALEVFGEMGLGVAQYLDVPGWGIWLFPKIGHSVIHFLDCGDGDFAFFSGTPFRRGQAPTVLLRSLYETCGGAPDFLSDVRGVFHLVVRKHGILYLFNDGSGLLSIYCNADRRVFSSCWLAVCRLAGRLTLDVQSAYEYVFNGTVLGDRTLAREVDLLPLHAHIECRGGAAKLVASPPAITRAPKAPREELVEESLRQLRSYVQDLQSVFPQGFNCALSGGYDSRLILGLLLEAGIRPDLFVYGNEADADVQVAQTIAAGEHLNLEHLDRAARSRLAPEAFPEQLRRNFYGCDGYAAGGTLGWDSEYQEVRRRTSGGRVFLNGGGGEVFRNFFYLRNRRFTVRELLWSFYAQFEPRWTTSAFSEAEHFDALAAKVTALLGDHAEANLDRQMIEWLYPNFRCRSWVAKELQSGNRAGAHLNPFLDHRVSQWAASLPTDLKDMGLLEAELIRRVNPRLAGYLSAYGHAFDAGPPWSYRASYRLNTWRSPRLRRIAYRVQARVRGGSPLFAGYGSWDYLKTVFGDHEPQVARLFRIDRVGASAQWHRIWSLEYACRELALQGPQRG